MHRGENQRNDMRKVKQTLIRLTVRRERGAGCQQHHNWAFNQQGERKHETKGSEVVGGLWQAGNDSCERGLFDGHHQPHRSQG